MRTRRVVLLSNHSVLAAGVQRVLQGVPGVELAVVAADDPQADAKVRRLAPAVLVLDAGDPFLAEGHVTRVLEERPGVRVIALNFGRTGVEVYRVRRVVQTSLDGLLQAIQGRRAGATSKRKRAPSGPPAGATGGEAMDP